MTLEHDELIHQGRIIRLERHTVEFPDGSAGQLDVVRHPGASAVVPFLDDPRSADPRILLIRHFRHAAGGWLWEIPAGRLDAGEREHPERCARRELAGDAAGSARLVLDDDGVARHGRHLLGEEADEDVRGPSLG